MNGIRLTPSNIPLLLHTQPLELILMLWHGLLILMPHILSSANLCGVMPTLRTSIGSLTNLRTHRRHPQVNIGIVVQHGIGVTIMLFVEEEFSKRLKRILNSGQVQVVLSYRFTSTRVCVIHTYDKPNLVSRIDKM